MRVLLDSNIIIDLLHGIAEAKIEMLYHADRVISAITWMELMTAFHAQREKGIMKPEDFKPAVFDTYIALDPSLWWNDGALLKQVSAHPVTLNRPKNLYIGSSADGQSFIDPPALAATFGKAANFNFKFENWPAETHATIYHPAALKAFRLMLGTQGSR